MTYAGFVVHMPCIENYLKAIIISNSNTSTQELEELQVKAHNHPLYILCHIPLKCSIMRAVLSLHIYEEHTVY